MINLSNNRGCGKAPAVFFTIVADEKSLAKRSERELQDWQLLWRRNRLLAGGLALVVCVTVLLPWRGAIVDSWFKNESLEKALQATQGQLDITRREGDDAKRERDSKAAQLAPFLAAANQRFENDPPDKRLDLLLDRLAGIEKALQQKSASDAPRVLDAQAIERIKLRMDFLEKGLVEIECEAGNREAADLAEQIKTLFVEKGFQVKGVSMVMAGHPLPSLSIFVRPTMQEAPGAFVQLFQETGSQPSIFRNHGKMNADYLIKVGAK